MPSELGFSFYPVRRVPPRFGPCGSVLLANCEHPRPLSDAAEPGLARRQFALRCASNAVRRRGYTMSTPTGGRGGRALAGRKVDDNVVFSPHVDPTHVELGRHDRVRDDTEVALALSREFPCIVHVEPDESTADGVGCAQA
jgi:hypothetical protein